jgi:hypothetical protein
MARYALVVGISQYEEPFEMLSKADQDANAVKQTLERDGGYKVTSLTTLEKGSVKGDDLYNALEIFLQQQASGGEALIYFTGHGFQTVNPRSGKKSGSYLATSDCTVRLDKNNQIINQENGLSFAELNELIQKAECSSLVVLLDSCHSGGLIAENLLDRQSVDASLSSFKDRKDYYFITACRSHQVAEAEKRGKHSIFTQALLSGLDRRNADKNGRITTDRLFDLINTELADRQQEPLRIGSGRAIAIVEYKPILQSPSGMVALEEMANLLEILQLQDIEKYIQQSYTKYVSQDHQLEPGRSLSAILEQLNTEFPSREGKPQRLFEFVNGLIGNLNVPILVRDKLQSWASNTAQAYGVSLAVSTPVTPSPVTPYLLIRLKPSTQQEDCLFVKAWFFLDNQTKTEDRQFKPLSSQKFPEEKAYPFEELAELLNEFLEQTLKEVSSIKNTKQPIIEFFLPKEYLCATVEQLTVLDAIDEEIQIGTDYQVVVRSYERLTRRYRERAGISWLDKWNRAKQLSPPVPQDLFERLSEADDYDWDSLRASLVDKVGLQLACPPLQSPFKKSKASGNKRDLVSALLSTATPIAIWTRCPVSEPTFVSAIDELFNAGALSQLPEYVRKKRLEAMQQQGDHIGQHLVLLWEDPERLPPDGEAFEFQTAS